jgi:ammonium transporter, Amt family
VQLGYQLADSVAGFSYSFVMTSVILFIMNFIPGLSLRVAPEEEEIGLDDGQIGEFAYDYVELQRHTSDITHAHAESLSGSGDVQPEKAPADLV